MLRLQVKLPKGWRVQVVIMNAMKIDQGNAGRQVLSRVSLPSLNSGRVVSCEAVAHHFGSLFFRPPAFSILPTDWNTCSWSQVGKGKAYPFSLPTWPQLQLFVAVSGKDRKSWWAKEKGAEMMVDSRTGHIVKRMVCQVTQTFCWQSFIYSLAWLFRGWIAKLLFLVVIQ